MGGDEVGSLTGAKRSFSAKPNRPTAVARTSPSLCRNLAPALISKPEFASRIELGKLPTNDPHAALLTRLVEWLNTFEIPPSPAVMLEDPDAPHELGELQGEAEMLEQKGNWNPEAELTGGIAQLNSSWERRRREELARRDFNTLSPADRAELLTPGKNLIRPGICLPQKRGKSV